MHVFFSNQIEKLYERLKTALFQKNSSAIFSRRLIIVPSPAIKSWLMLQLAQDPAIGIAAGLEICYLDQAIDKLSGRIRLPSELEISFAIESEIKNHAADKTVFKPLTQYLKGNRGKRRLIRVADKLAYLFQQYGIYGGNLLKQWTQSSKNDWQAALWKTVYQKKEWSYLARELASKILDEESIENIEVHVFSVSFISKTHHQFFVKSSQLIPFHYYMLSPCQAFWSDICSDRESYYLQNFWKKKGVSDTQEEELEEYLRERNPLLANFGRLGREMVKMVEESNSDIHSDFVLPQEIDQHKQYSDLLFDDVDFDDRPLSLLTAIQADMALLRNPDSNHKIDLDSKDRSIQIHAAASKLREVQVIYDLLLGVIQRHQNDPQPVSPSDIILMAPNIMEYEPYIKSVFGSEESVLDFHVIDLDMPSQSLLVQGFLHLLNLPATRWDAVSLMRLFDYPAFQESLKMRWEDVCQIREWISAANIRWGHDSTHRNELLSRDHGLNVASEPADERSTGTWTHGISRLLAGLMMQTSDCLAENNDLTIAPLESIDSTQAELLGKFIALVKSLREDLRILNDGTQMTLGEWSTYLKCLLEAYFGLDDHRAQQSEDGQMILDQIESFRKTGKLFDEEKFSFDSIKIRLEASLNKQRMGFRDTHLNSVRFCSMLPMRAIPSRIIVSMGMNEGDFPRVASDSSLDLMRTCAEADYAPSQTDYDRYLFLESLLSAREYFLMSYISYSTSDGKEQSPSLLVQELSSYIEKGYCIGGKSFKEMCLHQHPFHAFDKSYFEKDTLLPSYLTSHYRMAQAYYRTSEKSSQHQFFPDFISLSDEKITAPTQMCLDLKQLSQFVKNPLKMYFNKTLGIYIRNQEQELKSDEEFVLTRLELSSLRKASLIESVDHLIASAEHSGILPDGPFKEIEKSRIKKEAVELSEGLAKMGIKGEDVFSVELLETCIEPCRDAEGNWQVPPFTVKSKEGVELTLVGVLFPVTNKGLIAYGTDEKAEAIKMWAQFLIMMVIAKQNQLPIESQILFAKSGKVKIAWFEDPLPLFVELMEHYFHALENPSLVLPELAHHFLEEKQDLTGLIDAKVHDAFHPYYNDYLKWICRTGSIPDCGSFSGEWKKVTQTQYGAVFDNWYA